MLFHYFHARPLQLAVLLVVASLLGVAGYQRMPRNLYPDVERPQVTVITQLPGAPADGVAQKVSRPIEQALYALSLVHDVQSTSRNEVSVVKAEFSYEKGLDAALLEVSNALSRVRSKLPAETAPSSVYPVGAFTTPVLVLTLAPKPDSALGLDQVRLLAEGEIRSALLTQPHVADVEVFGGYEGAVRIEIDPLRLARYRLTPAQLADLLAKGDRDWPLGNLQGGRNLSLTVYGERADVAHLRALPLARGLTLGDVAEVRLTNADRYSAYHGNGKAGIALAILRAPGGAVETPIQEVETLLPTLRAHYTNIDFAVSDTQGELIRISNHNMTEALLDAVLFTSAVILLFLANWRALVTALVSLPVVFLITLAVLWLLGKELNVLVMTGIILALGMLVDDAVVVLENIERHLEELHEEVQTAVLRGTEEVLFPVFVGTVATAVVITPLMFVGDFPQQVYKHMILTVVIAVFVSWFVSITLIPLLSLYWYRNGLPPRGRIERLMERVYQRLFGRGTGLYTELLAFSFRGGPIRRLALLAAPVLLLGATLGVVVPLLGQEAMPPMDTGNVRLHLRFGANESVELAEARLREFEQRLMQDERVKRVSAIFGSEPGVLSLGSGQLPAEATLNITYLTRLERSETSWQIEKALREQAGTLPGVSFVDTFDSGATALSTIKAPVNLRLSADDFHLLTEATERARGALWQVPGLTSVSATWDGHTRELRLVLDEERLRTLGLTPDALAAQLPLKGGMVAAVSRLPSVTALPVRSYFAEPYRSNPAALTLLPIALPDGSSVPLGQLAQLRQETGTNLVTSDRLKYTVDLLAYRDTVPVSFLSERAQAAVRAVLPAGVSMSEEGDNGAGGHSTARMRSGLGVGVLLLTGVLIAAYGSVPLGLLSIAVLPLASIGSFWELLVFDKALGMPATLGLILLVSIIVKNSILMVDFIQQRRCEGESALSAAMGSVALRYRPILMTAFGTIAGMLPIAAQRAAGLERLSPLAHAAIGGLLFGTVLSLFYLPMLYVWATQRRGETKSTVEQSTEPRILAAK